MLDLDNLKGVNDTYGNRTGDQVLRCVADRMAKAVGEFGLVARIGGTVFAVLLPGVSRSKAGTLLENAGRAVRVPLEGVDVHLTATCGVVSSTVAKHWSGLLSRAEAALLEAKISKRRGIYFHRGSEPGWEERRQHERDTRVEAEEKVAPKAAA